jgi:hypothetical protein
LLAAYRRDHREGRCEAWPGLDADTYATGRFLGWILETANGHPISLEHQAMRSERPILSSADIRRLRELGDPEILRLDEVNRAECMEKFGYPSFQACLQAEADARAAEAKASHPRPDRDRARLVGWPRMDQEAKARVRRAMAERHGRQASTRTETQISAGLGSCELT